MTLRRAHRLNAAALGLFLTLHLGNHLVVFAGAEAHLATLTALRQLYRLPGVEHVIFALFAAQIVLSLALAYRHRANRRPWRRIQRISGVVVAIFLVQHLVAVLATRLFYPDIDTNTYWAASVVSRAPFSWYFVPYYTLGLTALLVHLIAVLHPTWPRRRLSCVAAVLAVGIVGGFMGVWWPVSLPAEYETYLASYWVGGGL